MPQLKPTVTTECEFCEIDGLGNHAGRCPVYLERELAEVKARLLSEHLPAEYATWEQVWSRQNAIIAERDTLRAEVERLTKEHRVMRDSLQGWKNSAMLRLNERVAVEEKLQDALSACDKAEADTKRLTWLEQHWETFDPFSWTVSFPSKASILRDAIDTAAALEKK